MSLFGDMSDARADDRVWKALADATRRQVVDLLCVEPRTTGELCAAFPELGRTSVMKHLDVLEEANLLLVRREGRRRWNYYNPIPIQEIHERWVSRHVAQRAQGLLALRRAAEHHSGNPTNPRRKPR